MSQPKINLPKEPIDNILDIVGLLGILVMIGLAGYYYNALPDEIPRHYNFKGEPDAWGNKSSIWTMPMIGILLFVLLFFINKIPHQFNYPMKITMDNAEMEYRRATRMVRYINLGIALLFLYITWKTIQTALGNSEGLGSSLIIIIFLAVAGLLGYAVEKTKKGS